MAENLSAVFQSVAFKTLVSVDLTKRTSHQHEINGSTALRAFFNTEHVSGIIHWHYFADNVDPLREDGLFTFYDARAKSADRTGRTEWRMYYKGDFFDNASPGDVLILARTRNDEVFGMVFEKTSAWLRAAQTLFQIDEISPRLTLIPEEELDDQQLQFVKSQILDELGIEVSMPVTDEYEELAIKELNQALKKGKVFPSTWRMCELAQTLVDVDFDDGDLALVELLETEERLFRTMETIVVTEKLKAGFTSVDDFIDYSLGVQNRRKSRMGFALQNHLDVIFQKNNLRFESQVRTEGKNTADFIFPGHAEYHDPNFKANLLVFLGAKSSLKDRWRQVLDEADRIPAKHLCTLEQAISVAQTDAMSSRGLSLVIPSVLHQTFTHRQRRELWSVNEFMDYVRSKQ